MKKLEIGDNLAGVIIVVGTILIVALALVLAGCKKLEYDVPVTYTVPEGKHFSNFPTVIEGKKIWCQVQFTESCRYERQEPGMSGWNKLIGLSVTVNPHKNSGRWAWRYDHDSDMIKLAGYVYINGERSIQDLFGGRLDPDSLKTPFLVPIGTWIDLYIGYDKQLTKWEYFTGESEQIGGWMRTDKFKGKNFWWLGLHFGGNAVAPHDVSVIYKFTK